MREMPGLKVGYVADIDECVQFLNISNYDYLIKNGWLSVVEEEKSLEERIIKAFEHDTDFGRTTISLGIAKDLADEARKWAVEGVIKAVDSYDYHFSCTKLSDYIIKCLKETK